MTQQLEEEDQLMQQPTLPEGGVNIEHKSRLNYKVISLFMMFSVVCIVFYISSIQEPKSQCPPVNPKELVGYYGKNVPATHIATGSSSSISQQLFDEGILQMYGFNQVEARRNLNAAVPVTT